MPFFLPCSLMLRREACPREILCRKYVVIKKCALHCVGTENEFTLIADGLGREIQPPGWTLPGNAQSFLCIFIPSLMSQ